MTTMSPVCKRRSPAMLCGRRHSGRSRRWNRNAALSAEAAAHGFLELALHLKLGHASLINSTMLERRIGDGLGGAHGRKARAHLSLRASFHETIGLGKARLPLRLAKCPFELAEFTQLIESSDTHERIFFALGAVPAAAWNAANCLTNPGQHGAPPHANQ